MVWMKRQSVITRKKRGPPATGKGTLIGVRLQPEPLERLDEWAASQDDRPSRPEAMRRLIQQGLASGPTLQSDKRAATKAAHMAGKQIDRMADQSATVEERTRRKRRLIEGPTEFRELRSGRAARKTSR
jgi:hypothetical protein